MREDFDFRDHVFRRGNKTPIVVGSSLRAFQSLIATIVIIGIAVWFLTLVGQVGNHAGPKKEVSPQKVKSLEEKPHEKFNRHWEVL